MTITTCDWPECRETDSLHRIEMYPDQYWTCSAATLWLLGVVALLGHVKVRHYCPAHYKLLL